MRREAVILAVAGVLIVLAAAPAAVDASAATTIGVAQYRYLSPVPGSQRVSPWNNIAIRLDGPIDPSTVSAGALSVQGSTSGSHSGRRTLSDDETTLIFVPDLPFTPGETVQVRLDPGIRTRAGDPLPPLAFGFTVSATKPQPWRDAPLQELMRGMAPPPAGPSRDPTPTASGRVDVTPCITFPAEYPDPVVLDSSDPEPGALFLAPFSIGSSDGHLLVLDNHGMPLFYRYLGPVNGALDFKRQPNGLLTYFQGNTSTFYALDSCYMVVDSFTTGNGYLTDLHDLQLLPNGHALLMSYDPELVDMSVVVPGGDPNATVLGLILQEIDFKKNVVFQWRSWDHFAITDAMSPLANLTGPTVDYVHGNAVELDQDGNLLLSSRHMSEITKIDRQTGDILWRMGAHAVNNQFTFVGDDRGFSHQHDIRRQPDGHITLFDNGNFLDPTYSRALEYELDEVNKVATLVWEHRNSPDVYSGFMGDVQRREDGGTVIGWGGTFGNPKLTDLRADGSIGLEIGFEDAAHMMSYRAFRHPWRTNRFAASPDSLDFGSADAGTAIALPLTVRNTSTSPVTINCYASTDPAFAVEDALIATLAPGETLGVQVTFRSLEAGPHTATLYVREMSGTEIVAQCVALRGTIQSTTAVGPDGGSPGIRLEGGWPNPFGAATAVGFTLPSPERVRLDILDVNGRAVATLVDGARPAGGHVVRWAPAELPSGVYFARLRVGARTLTRRLVHLR